MSHQRLNLQFLYFTIALHKFSLNSNWSKWSIDILKNNPDKYEMFLLSMNPYAIYLLKEI